MSSISIRGAAKIEDLAALAVELEQEAGAWRVGMQQHGRCGSVTHVSACAITRALNLLCVLCAL